MSVFLVGESALSSFIKMILLLIIFILILIASYYTTKWYAKTGFVKNQSHNVEVIETFPMGQNRQICILRIGTKYIAVSVCKDSIQMLTEIPEDQIEIFNKNTESITEDIHFKDVFRDMLKKK